MATSAPVVLVARWQVRDDDLGEVLTLVAELRDASLAEPGCNGYEVFRTVDASGELLLLEHYRDDAALDAHRQSLHYRALVVERILPLLAGRKIEILNPRRSS